jgi:hypothetical protein
MTDEATFFAWLDGELSGDAAADVERQVVADPVLQRQADEHRQLAAELRDAFALAAEAPLPPRLTALLEPATVGRVVSLADARERRAARSAPTLWKQMAAMAATLAFGIVVGNQFSRPAGPVHAEAGRLVASAQLESALQTQLASAPADEGTRIGMTFRDGSGAICRTFEDQAVSGLACRERGDWRILGLFPTPEGQKSDYRMAAGPNPNLMSLVDERMVGDPFDATQERSAQDRDWR